MADELLQTDDEIEISLEETSWAPPPGVTRHSGFPIEPEQDFFADPNPEIGEVLTAETNLKVGKKPWRSTSRFVIAGLVGWAGAMAFQALVMDDAILEGLIFAALAVIVWFVMRFARKCSFVGTNGACRFSCKGNRAKVRPTELFVFENATDLRTSQTRQYYNGFYMGTSYSHTWTDGAGKKVFKLSGTYRGEKKPPKPSDPFHFAVSTEAAWTNHVLAKVARKMDDQGFARFPLSGKDWVAVGNGYLEVSRKGVVERLGASEIGEVSIDAGVVKIKRTDAKEGWFSSTGVHKFPYDSMANFQAFAQAYARWVVGHQDAASADVATG